MTPAPMRYLYAILVMACAGSITAYAQQIRLLGVDASSFPMMKARFHAIDASGRPQRPAPSELTLTENATALAIGAGSVFCPPAGSDTLSATVTIDITGSMAATAVATSRLQVARAAAHQWVELLAGSGSECALTSFDHVGYLNQDFSTDRVRLDAAIDALQPQGGTDDVGKALYGTATGSLPVAASGRHKRAVLLITDAVPMNIDATRVVAEARAIGCTIHVMAIGVACHPLLRDIADGTGGQWFGDIVSEEQAEHICQVIAATAQGTLPCEIAWNASGICSRTNTIELEWQGATARSTYTPPPASVAELVIDPPGIYYNGKQLGVRYDTSITVTAVNGPFTATSISSSNPNYQIIPNYFSLAAGASVMLTVCYVPPDSGYTSTTFRINADPCSRTYFASGGYPGKAPKGPRDARLRLVVPNGGETFTAGSDTAIIWEGIAPHDTVTIYASSDDGGTWTLVCDTASHNSYEWKNIPGPAGTRWKIRLVHTSGSIPVQEDASDRTFSIVVAEPQARNVNMGRVAIGVTADSLVRACFTNASTAAYEVRSIRITGADAARFGVVSGALIVPAGGSRDVEFRFTPATVGVASAQLLIQVQGDTLRRTITGEGMRPTIDIIGEVIDFGKVNIGIARDTLRAVTIRNSGEQSLTVHGVNIASPNTTDFMAVSAGSPTAFTLSAGATARMDLRFVPSAEGRTSGRLLVHHSGVGSPATVVLFGEGMDQGARIGGSFATGPALVCGTDRLDTVVVVNKGADTLRVSTAVFEGVHAADYAFDPPFVPMTIPGRSAATLTVRFTPGAPGARTATLRLTSNSNDNNPLLLPIGGYKADPTFAPASDTIQLGVLCPDEARDTTLVVRNTGDMANRVDVSSTGIQHAVASMYLPVGATATITIRYPGRNAIGPFSEWIVLTDTICNVSRTVVVAGLVEVPSLTAEATVIVTRTGLYAEKDIVLTNDGGRDLVIGTFPAIAPFEYAGTAPPVLVPAHGQARIRIRYAAPDTLTRLRTVEFTTLVCPVTASVDLTGRIARPSVHLRMGTAEAYAGQHLGIPVYADRAVDLAESGATGFGGTVRFNASMLLPDVEQGSIVGRQRIVPLALPILPDSSGVLGFVDMRAALGNDSVTALVLENVTWIGDTVAITMQDGMFRLLDVCRQGTPRLLSTDGRTSLTLVENASTRDGLTICMETIEEGHVFLRLVDLQGRIVAIIANAVMTAGTRNLLFDTSAIPAGSYFLVMSTPTVMRTLRVDIIR